VVFLHRIVAGGTDRSYGIHVARLAGVPQAVLARARQLLATLAVQHVGSSTSNRRQHSNDADQLPLFVDPTQEVAKTLASTDPNQLTPIQALELLRKLRDQLGR
jgi:DNA mismatch repair protein MutS